MIKLKPFPQGFLWGGATAANAKAPIMLMAVV